MNLKNKFFIICLMFLVLISISVVSAAENATDIVSNDENAMDVYQDSDEGPQEVMIVAKDYNSYYDSGKALVVRVMDYDGDVVDDVDVNIRYSSKNVDYECSDDDGKCYFYVDENVGSQRAKIFLDDYRYTVAPLIIKVKVTKAPVKFAVSKVTSKTNKYATLKAVVKDKWGNKINQGSVKFKINGNKYKVKVKNGVATKKIKLKKAKTYYYSAVFSAKNYDTKKASSKVIVKQAKKTYTYKKGKFSFKVSESQYKKIKYVKNHKHQKNLPTYANFKVKTNQKYYGETVYAVVTTWSGIRNGQYLHYPQVQFVVMYGEDTWEWDYLTAHYSL